MRAIVQKVTKASVTVGERSTGSIGQGLAVLLGISSTDTEKEAQWMANKLTKLRIFDSPETGKPWDADLLQCKHGILIVSQFTLQCVLKGNKPDFHQAMKSEQSKALYNYFVTTLRQLVPDAETLVQEGEFGALMQVHIQNDGPVTIPIDTPPSLSTQKIKPQKPQKPKHSRNNDRNGENQCKVDDEAVDNVTHELAQL